MQKIQSVGFFFENRLRRKYDAEKNFINGFLGYIFINIQIKH